MIPEDRFDRLSEEISNYFRSLGESHDRRLDRDLYHLQHILFTISKKYPEALRLNPSIYSKNILESFSSRQEPFKAVDYQLNLLHHLASAYKPSKELHHYVDEFVYKFKEQLSFKDIVITVSGVTRIHTNLRFAVLGLRDLGLVVRKDKSNKRVIHPSVLGLLVLTYIRVYRNKILANQYFKEFGSITLANQKLRTYSKGYQYDALLVRAIYDLKDIDFVDFMAQVLPKEPPKDTASQLRAVIDEYAEYILDMLEISEKGIRARKGYEEKSKRFIARMEEEELSLNAHGLLMGIFKSGVGDHPDR